VALFRQYCIF